MHQCLLPPGRRHFFPHCSAETAGRSSRKRDVAHTSYRASSNAVGAHTPFTALQMHPCLLALRLPPLHPFSSESAPGYVYCPLQPHLISCRIHRSIPAADPGYASNNDRVRLRPQLLPELRQRFGAMSAAHMGQIFEANGLPYAPISKPEELLEDPHLLASGGLAPVHLSDGERRANGAHQLAAAAHGRQTPGCAHGPAPTGTAHAGAAAQPGLRR